MKADKTEVLLLLKTAKGHIEGIMRMVEDDRYCMDISNQIFAVEALMRKTNNVVLKAHLLSCVRDTAKNGDVDKKIDELVSLFNTLTK